MTTKYFRETVSNEYKIDSLPPYQWMTQWQFARMAILFVVLFTFFTLLLVYFNGQPTIPPTTPAALSPATTAQPAGSEPASTKRTKAIAVIRPIGESAVSGTLRLIDLGDEVEIRGVIEGLTPGQHGFHIHEFGDLSDAEAGKSAGGHFNPTDQPHGSPDAEQRHVGDLGNIEADKDGKAIVNLRDRVIQLDGPHSIIGRAFVIHAGADQFTQPAGDAGARVAFGVIGISSNE